MHQMSVFSLLLFASVSIWLEWMKSKGGLERKLFNFHHGRGLGARNIVSGGYNDKLKNENIY